MKQIMTAVREQIPVFLFSLCVCVSYELWNRIPNAPLSAYIISLFKVHCLMQIFLEKIFKDNLKALNLSKVFYT